MIDNSDIKITNLEYYKVGSDDCEIYLGDIKLYPLSEPIYEEEYLTFRVLNEGIFDWSGTSASNTLSYSLNGGVTWSAPSANISITLQRGKKVMWKGTCTPVDGITGNGIGRFSQHTITADDPLPYFIAEGNVMSLLYGDNFSGQTSLAGKNYAFNNLFYASRVYNAENLVLPATTLSEYCYSYMFRHSSHLTTAPTTLPATTLTTSCYQGMFENCTGLITAPVLSATTMGFASCTDMFSNCWSLTTAPELPATTLSTRCYTGMFQQCSGLTTAQALPATTLAGYCYSDMFYNCTSLTTAPSLPATTLVGYCYNSMFHGCTSLTTAPVLKADTLANECYNSMFSGCTSLNSITCLATDISASYCTYNWVKDVASTGTFYKHPSMTGWTTGDSGIPTNWTVQDAEIPEPLTFIVQEAGTFQFIKNGTGNDIQYSINGGAWTTLASSTNTPALASGDTIAWKATLTPPYGDYNGIGRFTSSGRFAVEGNAMSMLYGDDFEDKTSLDGKNYAFGRMFSGCTGLTAAENMLLPATTLSSFCYLHLFKGCTSLTSAPVLPAATLADWCYYAMFSGCTSLNSITCLATDISAYNCTANWVKNVASSGTFYKSPNMSSWTNGYDGYDGIPIGWTVQDAT